MAYVLKGHSQIRIAKDITTGPPTCGMVRCLLEEVALSKFDKSALAHGAETMLHYDKTP
jgi:hypothetical protein